MTKYETALKIAATAHASQTRKHDNTPYVTHPIMVARILEQAGFGEIVVCAALVHDVLEDTAVLESELRDMLGHEIVNIVAAVSEDKNLSWEERKTAYINIVVDSGEAVWALSVADKIHNASDFIHYHQKVGKEAWKIFNRDRDTKIKFEKDLYNRLAEKWNHPILGVYSELINKLESLEY